MALLGLGYAGFGSASLEDWRQFGTGLVGLQAVERGNSLLAFRMDDRKQRIVIDRAMGEGARFFGWEVADHRSVRVERNDQSRHRQLGHHGDADAVQPVRAAPATLYAIRMPAAMITTGAAVDCIPTASPSMMLVA